MDNLKSMTLQEIIAFARNSRDPVDFAKSVLTFVGAELGSVIREELATREEQLKLMKRETKVLAITFAD